MIKALADAVYRFGHWQKSGRYGTLQLRLNETQTGLAELTDTQMIQ